MGNTGINPEITKQVGDVIAAEAIISFICKNPPIYKSGYTDADQYIKMLEFNLGELITAIKIIKEMI